VVRRGKGAIAFVTAGALAAVLAMHLGWFSADRSWQVASGWDRIPAQLRAPSRPLWVDDADGAAPRLAWLGHAGFLLRWKGVTLLLDPNLSDHCSLARRLVPAPVRAADLGRADAVLLSHAHYDHMDLPTLAALEPPGEVLLPAGDEGDVADVLQPATRIRGLAVGERVEIGALSITAVPAAHGGGRHHPLPRSRHAQGDVIAAGENALYFSGDTGRTNDFRAIARGFHPRVAILPIGAYAPRIPVGLVHLNPEQAVSVGVEMGVELVVPCHFGTFTLSLDPAGAALPRFARAAATAGLAWSMPEMFQPMSTPTRSPAP
jgi:L-ascorbate metabolism protein UlaG (beta-lactamase superfamily)